jgi:hypothetical protein
VASVLICAALAAAPPKPKAINCGKPGLIWAKTFNVDNTNKNYLVAVDSSSLQVVYNWTWVDAWNFLYSAYDVTSGLLVFYDGQTTLQYYNTKTRKFADDEVNLSLENALDIFFDNQGVLWALYFDPQNDKKYLFCTVDIGTGSVDPRWSAPNAPNGLIDGDGSFDFNNNVYYWDDGSSPNNLMSMNVNTGKSLVVQYAEVGAPVFINGGNQIVGELWKNDSLVSLGLSSGKTTVIFPQPPALISDYTQIYDLNTNSYIIQVLNDNTEVYFWWAIDLKTQKTRQANSAGGFLGAHLCPAKV